MGKADVFHGHRYFVHVASTDVAKFDLHTQSSFDELCTLLVSEVSEGSSKARVADVERAFGIKYDKHAVAFCPAASKVAMIPESVFPDSMHNMLASGGVLQFELNQLTRRITRLGYSQAELDAFAARVNKPRHGVTKLPKSFCVEAVRGLRQI